MPIVNVSKSAITIPSDNFSGGLFDYNDAATSSAPISVVGGGASSILTNDGLGAFTNTNFTPVGISSLWDTNLNKFDWSELKLGDMVDVRLDIDVTTTQTNTEVRVDLVLALGGFSYSIPWILETNYKTSGIHKLNRYNGVYMGDSNTLNNPAHFTITSDKNCDVVVNGWYIKVISRG